jgi:nitroreductase
MIEILRYRRSVRRFVERPVEADKVEILEEALVRAPSSRSINPWEFIVIEGKGSVKELSRCKPHGAGFLASAPLAVVFFGDTACSDTCIEDCSIAAISLQYAAQSLELGSCWCQVRLRAHDENRSAEEYVRELLGIPDRYLVECIVGIGYPAEEKTPHEYDSLDWGKIHYNKYKGN